MLLRGQFLPEQLPGDVHGEVGDLVPDHGLRLVPLDLDLFARPGDHLLGFLPRGLADLSRDPLPFRHRVLNALAAFRIQFFQVRLVFLADLLNLSLLLLDALEFRSDPLPALAHRGKDDRVERAANQEEEDDEADRVSDELIEMYELLHSSALTDTTLEEEHRDERVDRERFGESEADDHGHLQLR